jgi:hypothetical protein
MKIEYRENGDEMTINQDIASWLREAGVAAEMLYAKTKDTEDDRMNLFFIRANLIESMRCETCRWWENYNALYGTGECHSEKVRDEIECNLSPPPRFSCCHWEGRK